VLFVNMKGMSHGLPRMKATYSVASRSVKGVNFTARSRQEARRTPLPISAVRDRAPVDLQIVLVIARPVSLVGLSVKTGVPRFQEGSAVRLTGWHQRRYAAH
jgi:hypothetical protein